MVNLSKNAQKMVADYEQNLRQYIHTHQLPEESFDDIHARIWEKIEGISHPKESDIARILAEIGTPEEIFSEEFFDRAVNTSVPSVSKPSGILHQWREKMQGMIFLWVCKKIADMLMIPVLWVRLVALFLLVVLPVLTGSIEIGIIGIVGYFFAFLVLKTRVFWLVFYLILTLIFGFVFFWASMVFVAYLANIPVRDMYPFMHLSPVFSVGITLGVLSLGMLFAYCGARLFGKTLSIYVLLFGVVSLVISMACGVVFVSETVIVYSHEEVEKRTHTMPVMLDTVIKVFPRAWGSYDMFGMGVPSLPMYRTRIEPSETENIELVIGIEHRGSHEIREQSKRFIEAVSGTIDASHALQLQVTPNTHEKFPLLFIRADIEVVKMPAWQRFYGLRSGANGSVVFPHMEQYSYMDRMHIEQHCPVYYYDAQKVLHCDITEAQIQHILQSAPFFSLRQIEYFARTCIEEYQRKNTVPKCASIVEAYDDLARRCKKHEAYIGDCRRIEWVSAEEYFSEWKLGVWETDMQSELSSYDAWDHTEANN